MTVAAEDQPEDDLAEYVLAGQVFYLGDGTGARTRYNRGDTIRLPKEKARRLLRCGGVVPVGTPLPPQPALVSYGDPEDIPPWAEQTRKLIEQDVAADRLRPASGPHIYVK